MMSSIDSYNPDICDLCGSKDFDVLIENQGKRGLASGSRIIERRLRKIICLNCGLIRDGLPFHESYLVNYYTKTYQYNTKKSGEEHIFFTDSGPIPRSKVIHDWILELKPENEWKCINSVLEVGCGQGNLLARLSATFSGMYMEGVELSEEATNIAHTRGVKVSKGSVDQASLDEYDLIICFGVLEHVASPTTFLQNLKDKLGPNGEIITGQPVQDTGNYDVFYVDHLHHFESRHITLLSEKLGFDEKNVLLDQLLMKNFSLHLLGCVKNPLTTVSSSNLHLEYELVPKDSVRFRNWFDVFKRVNL